MSDDETLREWDLATRKELWQVKSNQGRFTDLDLSPFGTSVLACNRLYPFAMQLKSRTLRKQPRFPDEITAACWHEAHAYFGDVRGTIHSGEIYESSAGDGVRPTETKWEAHAGKIYSIKMSPGGRWLLSAGKDGRLMQWNVVAASTPLTLECVSPRDVAFDPTGRWLIAASGDELLAFDYRDLAKPASKLIQKPDPNSLSFQQSMELNQTHPGRQRRWNCLSVSPAADLLAAGNEFGRVVIWHMDERGFDQLSTFVLPNGYGLDRLGFSHDGHALAVVDGDEYVYVMEPRTSQLLQKIHTGRANDIRMSPCEDVLITNTVKHCVQLWHWPSATLLWESLETERRPEAFCFSADGQRILVDSGNRTVFIFDRLTGDLIQELPSHKLSLELITTSPDDRTIASRDVFGWFYLWHAATGKLLLEWSASADGPLKFSPDGAWLARTSLSGKLELLPMK